MFQTPIHHKLLTATNGYSAFGFGVTTHSCNRSPTPEISVRQTCSA